MQCSVSLFKEQQLYFCCPILQSFLSHYVLRRLLEKKYGFLGCILSVNNCKVPMEPSMKHETVWQQVVTHSILYTFRSTSVCSVCKYQRQATYTVLPLLLLRTTPVPCHLARVTVCFHWSRRIGMMINTCHTFATAVLSAPLLSSLFNRLMPELNPSAQRCLTRSFTGDFASSTAHFVNIHVWVKNQQMQQLFIQFINYVWYLIHVRQYITILRECS
jgi:hypothetical protein